MIIKDNVLVDIAILDSKQFVFFSLHFMLQLDYLYVPLRAGVDELKCTTCLCTVHELRIFTILNG